MDIKQVIILDQSDRNVRAPGINDFDKVCRVCLNVITETTSKTINDEECRMRIKTLLEVYTFVTIPDSGDPLPQHVCSDCIAFLIEIHTFRSRCKVNEHLLNKIRKHAVNDKAIAGIQSQHSYASSLSAEAKPADSNVAEAGEAQIYSQINDERMGVYRCKDCHVVYNNKQDHYNHRMEARHSRRPGSACPYCGKMFNTTGLVQHIRTHTKEKPFECDVCSAKFAIKNNLQRHKRIHNAERTHICEICGRGFTRPEALKVHQKNHEKQKRREIALQNGELYEEDDGVREPCPVCKKMFSSLEQLKIHSKYHRHTFKCNQCPKVFSTKANLNTHIRVHTGEKPFKCPECPRSFSQSSSRRTHMSTHSGQKAYKCQYCERRFSVRGNLVAHMRIHTGATPHFCDQCKKGFTTSSTLKKHLLAHVERIRAIKLMKLKDEQEEQDEYEHVEEVTAYDFDEEDDDDDDVQDVVMIDDGRAEVIVGEILEEAHEGEYTSEEVVIEAYQDDETAVYYEEEPYEDKHTIVINEEDIGVYEEVQMSDASSNGDHENEKIIIVGSNRIKVQVIPQ